jgi:Domain of unknown function (DUF4105)
MSGHERASLAGFFVKLLTRFAMALLLAVIGILTLWAMAALWYQGPHAPAGKLLALLLWIVFSGATLRMIWTDRVLLGVCIFALGFAAALLWWHSIKPSNARPWAADVARMLSGEVSGDQVVLHNVRDFDWRTDDDYTQRWQTRTYDLKHLSSVDLITSYWSMAAIAHVLISFGFDDGQHVVFSVEIRHQQTQQFSEIGGFFKMYGLSIIAADERDVIRVRTNVRGEDDYLYHLRMPIAAQRSLFLAYVGEANSLVATPRFYNTITVNCTTLVYHMMRHIVGHLPWDYRLLLSGYLPAYVYKIGGLDSRFPLEQLRAYGHITDRAKAADRSDTFSADIRAGIPPLAD